MSQVKKKSDLSKVSFETALSELEQIVERLGSGKVDLEETVGLYQQAQALKEHCFKKIADAKMKVEKITGEQTSGNQEE